MAVELPNSRVITSETENCVAVSVDKNGVSAGWDLRKCSDVVGVPVSGIFVRTGDDLEFVAVDVEWMLFVCD